MFGFRVQYLNSRYIYTQTKFRSCLILEFGCCRQFNCKKALLFSHINKLGYIRNSLDFIKGKSRILQHFFPLPFFVVVVVVGAVCVAIEEVFRLIFYVVKGLNSFSAFSGLLGVSKGNLMLSNAFIHTYIYLYI